MRVLRYEDNPAIRDALSMLLDGRPGIERAGAFPNPLHWDRQVGDIGPDVIMVDIEMPDRSRAGCPCGGRSALAQHCRHRG